MVITVGRLCAATRSSSQELIVPNVVLFIPPAWIAEIHLEPKDLNSRKVQRNSKPRPDTQPNHDMTLLQTIKTELSPNLLGFPPVSKTETICLITNNVRLLVMLLQVLFQIYKNMGILGN